MSQAGRSKIILLLALNALLLLVMGVEVMSRSSKDVLLDNTEVEPVEQVAAPAQKVVRVSHIEDFSEIVQRPLFNRDRRPIEKEVAEAQEEAEADALALIGVVLTPKQQVAIIYSKTQKQPVKVALWEWIEGWRLVSVQASVVELRKGKRSLELALQRTSSPSVDARK